MGCHAQDSAHAGLLVVGSGRGWLSISAGWIRKLALAKLVVRGGRRCGTMLPGWFNTPRHSPSAAQAS